MSPQTIAHVVATNGSAGCGRAVHAPLTSLLKDSYVIPSVRKHTDVLQSPQIVSYVIMSVRELTGVLQSPHIVSRLKDIPSLTLRRTGDISKFTEIAEVHKILHSVLTSTSQP